MESGNRLRARLVFAACFLATANAPSFAATSPGAAGSESAAIPIARIGSRATLDYHGDALAVTATATGARLRCGFQKLEGRATAEGLWLASTAKDGGRLRLVASSVSRELLKCGSQLPPWLPADPFQSSGEQAQSKTLPRWGSDLFALDKGELAETGTIQVTDNLVRFIRPGLTEEYSVSVDGVRQDFVIESPPVNSQPSTLNPPAGELQVELALSGARAEATAYGAKLKLDGSRRELAYSRLRATDATGRELPARMEVLSPDKLAVRVADVDATYPVRIDPTFCDADWISLNPGYPGANGPVYAMVADGSGRLYVGGDFTFIGTVAANRIAKWDGSSWSALGSGMDRVVLALAVSGTNLYAGGDFTTAGGLPANRIAKWDGSVWSVLGAGVSGSAWALAASGTNLYVGGDFLRAGGSPGFGRIARWDGSNWLPLGSGMNSTVYALAMSGTNLYAGGSFALAGGTPAYFIAKWAGNAWSALGLGVPGEVYALAADGTSLYAGGSFPGASTNRVGSIAKWDGNVWSALGSGVSGSVFALAVSGTNLYAGGNLTYAGGLPASRIAKWDGSTWSPLGSGIEPSKYSVVIALAVSGDNLYAGGAFSAAGEKPANNIARWADGTWSTFNMGMNGSVEALAATESDLFVAGAFTTTGAVAANRITRWDGDAWWPLGSGMNAAVVALAVNGTNLYAGGSFTNAGGTPANRIAKWDRNGWSPLGTGMDGTVNALAVGSSAVFAGGHFTNAGGVMANGIARWDGNAWSPLGLGINGSVDALAVSGTNLFVGGYFTNAGGMPANHVAKWNGTAWSALSTGMDSSVRALVVNESHLYAGGTFTNAGGMPANRVARWDGNAWSALGAGITGGGGGAGAVYALAVSGADLYAGGYFTNAGGVPANHIAKWHGTRWSALGSGMGGGDFPAVYALMGDRSGHLFVAGRFFFAGDKVSPFIAQANIIPQRGVIQNIFVDGGSVMIDCLGLPAAAYAVERAIDVRFTPDLTTLFTTNAPAPDGLFRCTDSSPPNSTAFYRLRRP